MNTAICMKWGTKYGVEYVNRLYGMLARNTSQPFQLVCFTDDPEGISSKVVTQPLPPLGCDVPRNSPGQWSKLRLWGRELDGLSGPVLFLDLDVVITGPMDEFFSYGDPDRVYLARNWVRPLERLGQTSVFRFPVGQYAELLETFCEDSEGIAARYRYEQRYVTNHIRGGVRFWPRGWVRHFRRDCMGLWPLRYLRPARLPRHTRIVIFPGHPDPLDAMRGQWKSTVPHMTRWAHIKQAFTGPRLGGTVMKHVSRYVIPPPWISEHWRE